MAQGGDRLRRIGQGALLVFVLALVAGAVIRFWLLQGAAPPPVHTTPAPGPVPVPAPAPAPAPTSASGGISAAQLAIAFTAVTSLVSLCTFIVSTVLGWRKERRESAAHALALDKARLEIEKLRTELDGLRARSAAARPGSDAGP